MPQETLSVDRDIIEHLHLDYLRYLPPDYDKDPAKKWPLILFLHGAGERGDDLNLIKKHGLPKVVEERDIPFVMVAPQCPLNHWWSDFLPALDDILEYSITSLNVDPQQVYLTGLSMGGFGTWHMAVEYPHRFAAIAPVCGSNSWMYGIINRLCVITDIPTWVFHGAKDDIVPLKASQDMVEQLQACGGDVRFTIYPEAMHDSWTETYNNPEFYQWLLSHKKAE